MSTISMNPEMLLEKLRGLSERYGWKERFGAVSSGLGTVQPSDFVLSPAIVNLEEDRNKKEKEDLSLSAIDLNSQSLHQVESQLSPPTSSQRLSPKSPHNAEDDCPRTVTKRRGRAQRALSMEGLEMADVEDLLYSFPSPPISCPPSSDSDNGGDEKGPVFQFDNSAEKIAQSEDFLVALEESSGSSSSGSSPCHSDSESEKVQSVSFTPLPYVSPEGKEILFSRQYRRIVYTITSLKLQITVCN